MPPSLTAGNAVQDQEFERLHRRLYRESKNAKPHILQALTRITGVFTNNSYRWVVLGNLQFHFHHNVILHPQAAPVRIVIEASLEDLEYLLRNENWESELKL